MTLKLSIDDLELAATWLENYESSEEYGDGEDETAEEAHALAARMRAEVERRHFEAKVRQLHKETGAPVERVRVVLQEVRARRDA